MLSCMCSKYGLYLIMSEGIIDLHHIIGLLNVMSRRVVMVERGSM